VIDARKTLDETAIRAQVHIDAARGSLGLIKELERIMLAEVADFGHRRSPGRNR
jgi:hypothetical protein